MTSFGRRLALMLMLLTLSALAAISGCGHRNGLAPGPAVRIAPRIRFLPANAGAVTATPDSLSAEALDGEGNVIAGPVGLQIVGSTFRGQLDVPAGTGRRIRVLALERNTIIYQGFSGLIPVGPSETESVDVALRPSTSLALIPQGDLVRAGDSLLVSVVDTSLSPIFNISAYISADYGRFASSVEVRPGPDLPSGTDVRLVDQSFAAARPARTRHAASPGAPKGASNPNYQLTISASTEGPGILPGARRVATLVFHVRQGITCETGDSTGIRFGAIQIQPRNAQSMPVNAHGTVVTLRPSAPGLLPVLDTFDSDAAGWTAVGDPTSPAPDWNRSGGNPGGYISVVDAGTGIYWYFRAPEKYRGDLSAAYGRPLKFDLIESGTPNSNSHQVILRGAGRTLFYDTVDRPGVEWSSFRALLREGPAWTDSATGNEATRAQYQAVLACLSDVLILGEYISTADTGGLDNVIMGDTLGGGGPQNACISGKVTLNGVPAASAAVHAAGGGSTITASGGTYCLSAPSNTSTTVSVDFVQSSLNYHGSGVVLTGTPSDCGGLCSTLDLALVQSVQGVKRFSILAFAVPTVGLDSGVVEVIITDDSLQTPDTSAVVTITPDNGAPVRLSGQLANGVYFGSAAHIPGVATVPLDPGRGYSLQVDLEGDAMVDATGSIKLASEARITIPTAASVQPSSFDMTWTVTQPSDSLFFLAIIDSSSDLEQFKSGYNITSARFDGLSNGPKRATLLTWVGPFFQNAIFGSTYIPNLNGARIEGFFWSYFSVPTIDFSVEIPSPGVRPPVMQSKVLERFLDPRLLQALRKFHALAHKR